jgi:hypothetical protein
MQMHFSISNLCSFWGIKIGIFFYFKFVVSLNELLSHLLKKNVDKSVNFVALIFKVPMYNGSHTPPGTPPPANPPQISAAHLLSKGEPKGES